MREEDPEWLRREGRRLVDKGQAMLDMADNIEAEIALGERPAPGRPGANSGISATAREMAGVGWVSAQAVAERAGASVRNAASCLSRLANIGELESRKVSGYPAEYRSKRDG